MAEEVSTVAATEEPATTEEPAATDEPAEEFEYHFRGNVQHDGEPLEGVRITLEGNGFEAETETDADGRWEIGVPEKATYEVTLDEDTLPEGVVVAEGSATREAEFGLTRNASVNFFLGEGVRTTVSFFDQFLQRTVSGLNFGLLLALAAIGLSLIFGTTGLSNFAHAEMVTFGALMVLTFGVDLALPIWLAIAIAIVLSAGLGYTLDAVIWKPLRRRGVALIPLMIVSIGLSLALRYTYQFFYGGATRQLPGATIPSEIHLGPITLSWIDVASMATSVVVLLAFAFFLLRTRIGKATRAVSDNPSLAAASGIDVDRVIRIVWVAGGALAGLSGILWAYFRPGVSWDMGFQILLLIFAAVTLGGLGTAFGAHRRLPHRGPLHRAVDALAAVRHEVRRRAGRAHPGAAVPTAGNPRSPRENRIRRKPDMIDWIAISPTRRRSSSAPPPPPTPWPHSAWRSTFGYTGLLNFGQAGFMALGAYGYAISTLSFGFPVWASVLVGVGASVIFALILGIPTLRLRADYLAIVTIAAAEILRPHLHDEHVRRHHRIGERSAGYKDGFAALNPIPPGSYGFGPFTTTRTTGGSGSSAGRSSSIFALLTWLIMRSPWGRVIKGIREDEDAVRALGKNVYSYKMQSLILGGVLRHPRGMSSSCRVPSSRRTSSRR
jgi:branched-chain amino acid transport system permease protein